MKSLIPFGKTEVVRVNCGPDVFTFNVCTLEGYQDSLGIIYFKGDSLYTYVKRGESGGGAIRFSQAEYEALWRAIDDWTNRNPMAKDLPPRNQLAMAFGLEESDDPVFDAIALVTKKTENGQ